MSDTADAPRVFVSYSHDSAIHEDWVLTLATRLMANGVDIVLDQWDLRLGGDLPRFMELGLTDSRRVIAICTARYVTKANAGLGGVGYEKMILTAQLMQDVTTERILPVIRDNVLAPLLPTFLGSRVFVDFRDDRQYEAKYAELLREIHGEQIRPRPPLGPNPFRATMPASEPLISNRSERYVAPALAGTVTFDYSNNDGRFVIGAGDMAFETAWSGGGQTAIYAYNDPPSIRTLALAVGVTNFSEIDDATVFDSSSRVRMPRLGEIIVWQNNAGYYAAVKVERIGVRARGDQNDELTFSYFIQQNRSASFRDA
jgi:hypothetical protein